MDVLPSDVLSRLPKKTRGVLAMYIKAIKVNPKLLKWAGVALLVLLAVLLTMSFAGSRF